MARAVLLLLLCAAAHANMYDVIFPRYTPPAACGDAGCVAWADTAAAGVQQDEVDSWWFSAKEQRAAGSACAMPGANTGAKGPAPGTSDPADAVNTSYAGPFCICANSTSGSTGGGGGGVKGFCTPPLYVPEQLNLQLASRDIVVAAFVSYHGNNYQASSESVLQCN